MHPVDLDTVQQWVGNMWFHYHHDLPVTLGFMSADNI